MVTRAFQARRGTEATMTPNDDPWNPKAQQHSAISESHDYGKFFVKIITSVISWNGPFRHVGKESTFPSYPIGHEHMFSHHYGALLWMNEWMNEWKMPSDYHTRYAPLT